MPNPLNDDDDDDDDEILCPNTLTVPSAANLEEMREKSHVIGGVEGEKQERSEPDPVYLILLRIGTLFTRSEFLGAGKPSQPHHLNQLFITLFSSSLPSGH